MHSYVVARHCFQIIQEHLARAQLPLSFITTYCEENMCLFSYHKTAKVDINSYTITFTFKNVTAFYWPCNVKVHCTNNILD